MQFLGLKGRESYLEPQILAAYEELASTVVEEGYSSRVQDGKFRMLEEAADAVRLQSSTGLDSEIQVQWDDLPGALALLQEVRISLHPSNKPVTICHACPHVDIACPKSGHVMIQDTLAVWIPLDLEGSCSVQGLLHMLAIGSVVHLSPSKGAVSQPVCAGWGV